MNKRRFSKPIRIIAWGLGCLAGVVFYSGIDFSVIPNDQWGLNCQIGPDREELAQHMIFTCWLGRGPTGYRVEIGRVRITHYQQSRLFFW